MAEAYTLKVYPNPAGDAATVAMSLSKAANVEIGVYDVQGRLVMAPVQKAMGIGEHFTSINTATLANGVYFIRVTDGTSSSNIRIAIMH